MTFSLCISFVSFISCFEIFSPILGSSLLAIATALLVVSVLSSWYYLSCHALWLTGRKRMLADLKKKFAWCPFQIEEILLVTTIINAALFLISRVLVGQCPPGTSLFLQQTCNQLASSGGIPSELVYCIYWLPLMAQLF